jgi:hypothetical protein
MSNQDIEQTLFCVTMSRSLVDKIGVLNADYTLNENEIPNVFDFGTSYKVLISKLPTFMRSIGPNSISDFITEEEFNDIVKITRYNEDAELSEKIDILNDIIKLFSDIETSYHMSNLLSFEYTLGGKDRALAGLLEFDGNKRLEYIQFLYPEEEEDSSDESDDDSILGGRDDDEDQIVKIRSEVFIGDRLVNYSKLRVLAKLNDEYLIVSDEGKISGIGQCKLESNVSNSNFSSFINSFIALGSIKTSLIDDFSTMLTFYAQNFATETNDGSLKAKSNFRNQASGRLPLNPSVTQFQIEQTNNGESYWETYAWLNVRSNDISMYRVWCEECLMKLIIYLDLLSEMPDDTTKMPSRVPNQNVVFTTLSTDVNMFDIRMSASACELDKLFKKSIGMRDQMRSIISYFMILTADSYSMSLDENNLKVTTWKLFPLSVYPKSSLLTNVNYKHLYSLLKIIMAMTR